MATDLQASLEARWPSLEEGQRLGLAVSGGADSFALLHAAWQAGRPIMALTVDHGLRPQARAEAETVAAFCRERSIPHDTLVWGGEKPATGLQAAARTARYRLLCEAAERWELGALMTAHTADDQAETLWMRLQRGASQALVGMPPARPIAAGAGAPVMLHRPWLNVRRDETRQYAEHHQLPFVDDPSNEDEGFERVRVRALLAALAQQDLITVPTLVALADEQRRAQQWQRGALERQVSERVREQKDGALALALKPLPPHASEGTRVEHAELLARLVWALGGVRVASTIKTEWASGMMPSSMGGVLVKSCPNQGYWAYREPAAVLGRADGLTGLAPIPVKPGDRLVYDRRFIVDVPKGLATSGAVLCPLGQLLPRDIVTSTIERERISTLPVLASEGRLTHLPNKASDLVTQALKGWKPALGFLSNVTGVFSATSLLPERLTEGVIRY